MESIWTMGGTAKYCVYANLLPPVNVLCVTRTTKLLVNLTIIRGVIIVTFFVVSLANFLSFAISHLYETTPQQIRI